MNNLRMLGLDTDVYFRIFGLLERHGRDDIDDFEAELIEEILTMKISEYVEEIEDDIEYLKSDVMSIDSTIRTFDFDIHDLKEIIKKSETFSNIDSVKQLINQRIGELKLAQDMTLDDINAKAKDNWERVTKLIKEMEIIIEFLDSRKTINLRKPKELPRKSILNIRRLSKDSY